MVSNGSAFLLLIGNQIDRIEQLQVVNLALYVQQLLVSRPRPTFEALHQSFQLQF